MEEKFINLNRDILILAVAKYGRTEITVKVGNKFFYADIIKNVDSARIDFYKKIGTRGTFQKYGNGLTTVWVKPDATLGKDFFEHIEEISQAQRVVNKYYRVLQNW